LTPRALLSGDRIEIATDIELRVELFGADEDAPTEPVRAGERRIYSIVHADVTSYARLVENDDVGAAQQLETCADIIRSETERQGGWIENIAGDSLLMLFSSAYSSVTASIAWQKRLRELNAPLPHARRMEFRAGVNSGDVLVTPAGSVLGDAVNIAARIQSLAAPGGVMVSGAVRDQLRGHGELLFRYVRSDALKNISGQVRIYESVY
jgi:adenylate cyclase